MDTERKWVRVGVLATCLALVPAYWQMVKPLLQQGSKPNTAAGDHKSTPPNGNPPLGVPVMTVPSVWMYISPIAGSIILFFTVLIAFRNKNGRMPKAIRKTMDTGGPRFEKVGEISFMASEDPLGPGAWTAAPDNARSLIPLFSGSDMPSSLQISGTDQGFAMDHNVDSPSRECDELRYRAKYSDSSTIYASVEVASRDRSKQVFIAYVLGDFRVQPFMDGTREWSIGRMGEPCEKEWRYFRHPLREDVARTFGTMPGEWSYKRLLGIRLRGSMSISPIEFYAPRINS